MAHPGEVCRCLDEEQKNANSNDGLYSRFLFCMPKPEFRDADVNGELLPNTPTIARYSIFAFCKCVGIDKSNKYEMGSDELDNKVYILSEFSMLLTKCTKRTKCTHTNRRHRKWL
jgi:hypothetical protein